MDEITTTTSTKVSEVRNNEVITYELFRKTMYCLASPEDLTGGNAEENAQIIRRIFNGEKGPKRDIVVLNSAAALYVGKVVSSIEEGIGLAEEVIDSGKALQKLDEFVEFTNSFISYNEMSG